MKANLISNTSLPEVSDSSPPIEKNQNKLFVPWLTTSLMHDLASIFLLQPIFWVLGVEHFAPVLLAVWMVIKRLMLSLKIKISHHIWLLIFLFVWQGLHIFSLPLGELDLFLKSQSTLLVPICLFFVIYNLIQNTTQLDKVLGYLEKFGFVLVIFGTIFILGLWSGNFQSLIGYVLPKNIVETSHFFSEITTRSLGVPEPATGFRRVQSLLWHPNGYATVLIIIFAIQWYFFQNGSIKQKLVRGLTLLLTLVNLVFTYSRTLYVAFLIMVFLAWFLMQSSSSSRRIKVLFFSGLLLLILFYFLFFLLLEGLVDLGPTSNLLYDFVFKIRPYSVQTRLEIYEISWNLILQKPLWGWSTFVRIENLPSYFSAGSHSDVLSVIFLYGIPGLLFYLSFIGSVWLTLIKGYRIAREQKTKNFFALSIALMLAINLRQLTAGLLWDIYVGSSVWVIWALGVAQYNIVKKNNRLLSPKNNL